MIEYSSYFLLPDANISMNEEQEVTDKKEKTISRTGLKKESIR